MGNQEGILVVIIIVIIFLYITYTLAQSSANKQHTHNMLAGFWSGDSDFCSEAGLNMMCLYMDEVVGNKCAGYILAQNTEDDIVLNTPFEATISSPSSDNSFTIKFTCHDDIDETLWSPIQTASLQPFIGKLVLYKEDTVYAVLRKDSKNTELGYLSK